MSTKDKLIERLKTRPKDFTFEETVRLFSLLGFTKCNKGKTSGSRVIFENGDDQFLTHKPHPKSIMKEAAIKQILNYLTENNYIE
ncbi:MAG: type II toxin-antitoxin system HicA family toxin [Dysgonamonadaceae bacterium]|jgi:predicted RNA binding protein YcfA (HicA-like mRNA interferase family)|nr:type II toxin-antitoxin system HicA family toxin [Dysgonamonadaceae bacterium]